MTEQEWLASTNPAAMLRLLQMPIRQSIASDRKMRLFACACALASATRIAGTAYEQMLVDGQAPSGNFEYGHDPKRLAEIWCDHDGLEALMLSHHRPSRHPTKAVRADLLRHIIGNPWRPMKLKSDFSCEKCGNRAYRLDYIDRAVCAYGNCNGFMVDVKQSFPPLVLDLAQAIYDGDQSAAGPLHDALIDAGAPEELVGHFAEPCPHCKDAKFEVGDFGKRMPSQLAKHLRKKCACKGTQLKYDTHPKGCWALDLILGKE